ncbi:MAG: acetate--CoA ligase [Bacteroidia bacterium]|nr:acetate--CoA ligase [Bacteroidia bacterium]
MKYPYQIQNLDQYYSDYQKSIENPDEFWGSIAEHFEWHETWNSVVHSDFLTAKTIWFEGAKLNITENCLDRHLEERGNQPAIVFEPNDPNKPSQTLTYQELYDRVAEFSTVLTNIGIQKSDRVCIYMGMIPELAIAVLACARIGAIHSVIFGGFSAQSIADRVIDAQASCIITCDGAYRGNKEIPLKPVVDQALKLCDTVSEVVVFKHTGTTVNMTKGRDLWWHEQVNEIIEVGIPWEEPERVDAEDPLFILYTSGSTGKPKGVVHSTAGYMVWANYTFVNVFQYQPKQVHFCTADIGWITGHTYILYGPLSAGATTLMFEGIPTWPDAGRFWDICQKHSVDILYTAPTAIRSLMVFGDEPLKNKDLRHLKVLGTVGEPINEEAWHWYDDKVGKNNAPIVDTWWQTETGGIMISNLAGITPSKPSFATLPLPGIFPVLMDENGKILEGNSVSGNLCIAKPWPGMIRTTFGDHQRCIDTYFSAYKGYYFTGDGCLRDEDGLYRITGRVDDVLNVSGHRIGTAEVENAINMNPLVVESAVVGFSHDIKGQGIYAYVILNKEIADEEMASNLRIQILRTVSEVIGPIAKPDKIQFVTGLPKTRSGKIMRRILRKIAEGELNSLGDTSTLLDPSVVESIKLSRM